jgi:hypothetical protein
VAELWKDERKHALGPPNLVVEFQIAESKKLLAFKSSFASLGGPREFFSQCSKIRRRSAKSQKLLAIGGASILWSFVYGQELETKF